MERVYRVQTLEQGDMGNTWENVMRNFLLEENTLLELRAGCVQLVSPFFDR